MKRLLLLIVAVALLASGCIFSPPHCGSRNGEPNIVEIESKLTTRIDGWGVVSGTLKNFGTRAPDKLEVIVNFRDKETGKFLWWEFALLEDDEVCPGEETDFYLETIPQKGLSDWTNVTADITFRFF